MLKNDTKELVQVKRNLPYTTSMVVGKKFHKKHKHVLENIDNIIENLTVENMAVKEYFKEVTFVNSRNRSYRGFEITKKGFSILALGFTGQKAFRFKIDFINAFDAMEKMLIDRASADWKQARLQNKGYRKHLTDVISQLVEYATEQGSKSAKMYYVTITKETYKALKFIEKNEKVGTNFRDTLNRMDLAFLIAAEAICEHWIVIGMDSGYHYKDIYRLAMDKVIEYGRHVIFSVKDEESNLISKN